MAWSRWASWLAAAAAVAAPADALAISRTYPGAAPCDTTLVACIAAAAEGDVVQVATNAPIDEDVVIDRSLTLESAPGYVATIGAGLALRGVHVDLSGAGRTVVVRGLRMPYGRVTVDTQGVGNHSITVADCFIADSTPSGSARSVVANIQTPATLKLERNDVVANGQSMAILTSTGSGAVTIDVVGNRVRKANAGLSSDGIRIALLGHFDVTARVQSNLVYDVGDCACGYPAGIEVSALSTGQTTAYVVNNTVDQVDGSGIAIPESGSPQLLTAYVYNNIVTRSLLGIDLPPSTGGLVVSHGFNALFGNTMNQFGGYPPGPGTVNTDPLLADRDARDYHLLSGSSLVNAGIEPPGGLPAIDADGNVRVAGPGVDYGAFERGSTPLTTTTVGTTPTTTTLPGCSPGASFASVRCRLADLAAALSAGVRPGKLALRLAALAQAADAAVTRAEELAGAGRTRPRRKQLGRAARALGRLVAKLGSPKADALDPSVRDALAAAAAALAADVRTLRMQ